MLHNPQDVFKAYLADALEKTIQCDRLAAYDAIQPPNMTGMGDLVVVSPKLRLSGVDPKELKKLVLDLATKVPPSHPFLKPNKASNS
jgi:arginyl-tRNA synthetase